MGIDPGNAAWNRVRPVHHSGALRSYLKDSDEEGYPRGPYASPRVCLECHGDNDSQYNSASPSSSNTSCYLSTDEGSPEQQGHPTSVTFDMKRNIIFLSFKYLLLGQENKSTTFLIYLPNKKFFVVI